MRRSRFKERESPLTIGLRDPDHRATFSFFFAAGILVILTNFVHYILNPSILWKDLGFLQRALDQLHIFYLQEIIFLISFTIILLPCTILWIKKKTSGVTFGVTVFAMLLLVTCLPMYLCIQFHVHPALRVFFVLDQVRHWMRLISFVVENMRTVRMYEEEEEMQEAVLPSKKSIIMKQKVIQIDNDGNGEAIHEPDIHQGRRESREVPNIPVPSIRSLMYFMFAPTLTYQHSYPRSKGPIRLGYAIAHTCILDLVLVPIVVPVFRQLISLCENIGFKPLSYDELIAITFWSYMCGTLMLAVIGYAYVHCWHNGQAELLRFADREFYKNWWSASDAFRWMSVWNLPVQRWLTEYVYKPAAPVIGNRVLTVVLIFLVSGLSHDYILSFTMGFFVPVFMCVFAIIVPSIPVILLIAKYWKYIPTPNTNTNTFMIYIFAFGAVSMYSSIEYFSRINCPQTEYFLIPDFFVPRFLTCLELK
jgi:sterol O-acyltransferase